MKGFVKVSRDLHDTEVWNLATDAQIRAYLDLCYLMKIEKKVYKCKYGQYEIKKGQYIASQSELGTMWNWSRYEVRSFLKLFKSHGLLFANEIAIGKYRTSLLSIKPLDVSESQQKNQPKRQQTKEYNNNLSNDKYTTHNTGARGFVKPSVQEVQTELDRRRITAFSAEDFWSYYESCGWTVGRGKPMKSWKYCINTWVRFENKNGNRINYRPRDRKAEADERNRRFADYICRKVSIGGDQGHDARDGGGTEP